MPCAATFQRVADLHAPTLCRATARHPPASRDSNTPSWPIEGETHAVLVANATGGAKVLRSPDPARTPAVRAALFLARNAPGAARQAHHQPQAVAPSDLRPKSAALRFRVRLPCAACRASVLRSSHQRAPPVRPTRNSRPRTAHPTSATIAAP